MERTHPNFRSYEEKMLDGDLLFILGAPAFLNSCFLRRHNFTSESLWNTLPVFPQHFDRIYSVTFHPGFTTYAFHVIGRIEVDKKVSYIDLAYYTKKKENFHAGRIFFWNNHWTFINSLPCAKANRILSYLSSEGITTERDYFLNNPPYKWKKIPTLCYIAACTLHNYNLENITSVCKFLKNYIQKYDEIKKIREIYTIFSSDDSISYVNQSPKSLYSRAGVLWKTHMKLILYMYYL